MLSERNVQLERNTINSVQYHWQESLEINLVPVSIGDSVLKAVFAKHCPYPVMRQNWMIFRHVITWRKMTLIVRFIVGCKNVTFLSAERTFIINKMFSPNLFFSGRLFISDSVCHKNHQLPYKYRQLKMLARFIPCGFRIILSMLNLVKEVNLQRFIMLLTLKNFLE